MDVANTKAYISVNLGGKSEPLTFEGPSIQRALIATMAGLAKSTSRFTRSITITVSPNPISLLDPLSEQLVADLKAMGVEIAEATPYVELLTQDAELTKFQSWADIRFLAEAPPLEVKEVATRIQERYPPDHFIWQEPAIASAVSNIANRGLM